MPFSPALFRATGLPASVLLLWLLLSTTLRAENRVDFTRDIQPIFNQHCVKCHGPDEQNGALRYDSKVAAFSQADSGHHAIVPGDPTKSQLLARISSTHPKDQMPPKGDRLSQTEINLLTRWIQSGASWPESADAITANADSEPGKNHWSFQPLIPTPPPAVKDPSWPRSPLDQFIQAKRESVNLTPVSDAAPAALIRRATYDLTGLPPTVDEVTAFVKACDPLANPQTAYAALIDRLLNRPTYGERWGRHWMDWIRYADTAGDNSDFPIPQAYLYRNYLIDAFNQDLPYAQFITEQLAGDLLPAANQEERNRLTIATGYLAMARRFGSLVEGYPQHLTIEDTLDNLGRTMLGLTISCARCHDHKFDPISARDYYGLYGIFASTRYPFPGIELFQTQRDLIPLIPASDVDKTLAPHQKKTDQLTRALEDLLAKSEQRAIANAALETQTTIDQQRKAQRELQSLYLQTRKAGENLAAHLKQLPPIPAAYAVREAKPVNARIQIKGEPERPGAEVPRKFPDILGGQQLPPALANTTSGRLQLAQWITHPDNPLTARVIVNRIWQRHFGTGLVPTPSDFGLRGTPPTHPELLDWLAQEFLNNGGSIKHLHRLIMTSRTYQLSSHDQDHESNLTRDPTNQLLWKFNRQRLDAESIRDTLLLVSGQLDPTPQTKPYPIPPSKNWKYTQHHPFKDDYPSNKRSLYQLTKRLTAQPYTQTFDGPDPNVCTTTRDQSVTSLQALFFVNNDFLHQQATHLASNLTSLKLSDSQRLHHTYLTLLARPPTNDETQLLLSHLETLLHKTDHDPTAAWSSLIRSLLRTNEFIYID
ncbi:PSD1 and planctomycete cytochrome C domain-containing protein [Phragmitibacter flavus]|nr:PSD1 and planctomycete cytochrome C domain-containing protein [Phragmitibacter flavus]